ncbi:MAG: translation initiation factor IF-2 subunit beta [Nanoarchaeota archaeon]|nr:translation initiation factor IF-2 subunit beta [Nanoarchaeota archaeon]
MKDYKQLLKKAQSELPETVGSSERFQIEKIKGHIEGNKTILGNFKKIAKNLNRDPEHMLKYILRELATPGKYVGDRLILGTKVPASLINKKIKQYASEFVLCHECGKPDTKIISKKDAQYLKCQACGAEHIIKNI